MTKYHITKEFRGSKRWWTGAVFSAFESEAAIFASKVSAEAQIRFFKMGSLPKAERIK